MKEQFTATPLPFFFISKEVAAERISNYGSNKGSILSQELGRTDTRSIWYSREHIESLLQEIDLVNGDGLRIFFGAYESTHEYPNQTCLIMVPTREEMTENNSIIHKNVILEDEPDFENRSSLAREIWTITGDEDLSDVCRNFNHGSPCPPLCDGSDGLEFYR